MHPHKKKASTRVFLSHAYADTVLARKLRNALTQRLSLPVFVHEELSAGANWKSQLRKEIENADVFLALITPESVSDSWVLQETGAAWALDKTIISLVTRRDLLNLFPVALDRHIELKLKNKDTPDSPEKFVELFESSLAAAQAG
jgi:hypothetical protein